MTQEALKLAIQLRDTVSGYWTENEIPIIEKLIELLAQEQEPVAWAWRAFDPDDGHYGKWGTWKISDYKPPRQPSKWFQVVSLPYTAPPQRPWVGLTDEEIFKTHKQVDSMQYLTFANAIEAKLKEKNS